MTSPSSLTLASDAPARVSPVARFARRALRNPSFLFGAAALALILVAALAAPLLTSRDPYAQDIARRLVPPVWHAKGTWEHWLGTDKLGRDYWARLLYGARISLLIGTATVVVSGTIGTALGVAAGYFRGRVDMVIGYVVNVRLALPVVLVALAAAALVGSSLQTVILVLGLLLWDRFAVVARSATLQIAGSDYIEAARAIGCSTRRIVFSELLPNIFNPLIVVATLEMAHAILLEAALSFLGLGVQPPLPSWGLMISEGKQFMFFSPWVIAIPGAALALLVLAINLVGDGLRDVTAPENRS